MSTRLAKGGRLIDRAAPVEFSFNGKRFRGYQGDTLAAGLLANDQMLVGRSFKYHRPRGIVAAGPEEPNALVNLGAGARLEPNQRTTTTELFDGLESTSQNHWPSLEFDVGVVNNYAARFLPAGFYYKTFIHPRPFWKHVFEPIIRRSAGLGKAPTVGDADRYEQAYAYCDVLVVGAAGDPSGTATHPWRPCPSRRGRGARSTGRGLACRHRIRPCRPRQRHDPHPHLRRRGL
jgi:sarcosine oxidase, subunit alpha